MHGASCFEDVDRFQCVCLSGYTGGVCESAISASADPLDMDSHYLCGNPVPPCGEREVCKVKKCDLLGADIEVTVTGIQCFTEINLKDNQHFTIKPNAGVPYRVYAVLEQNGQLGSPAQSVEVTVTPGDDDATVRFLSILFFF